MVCDNFQGPVYCIIDIMSNGNNYLVTGGIDSTIKIWEKDHKDHQKGNIIQTLVGHTGTVLCIEHIQSEEPCQDYLVTGSSDRTIKIWK